VQAYLELKLSWELFQRAPQALNAEERAKLDKIARRQQQLEAAILSSREAEDVRVGDAELHARLDTLAARYASPEELTTELNAVGLNQASLAEAVLRDLRVEALLEHVASKTELASDEDAERYYREHPQAFSRPETRTMRHILVTFNNSREQVKALALLDKVRRTLVDEDSFAKAALRYSHCPTAMQGGALGTLKRGQLFPELEPSAFGMDAGEVSDPIESPIGLHILRCDAIQRGETVSFTQAREKILSHMNDKRREAAQKAWIVCQLARMGSAQTIG